MCKSAIHMNLSKTRVFYMNQMNGYEILKYGLPTFFAFKY